VSFRVGVLISGEGSNLQALIDTVHGRDGMEIACVGSNNPDARGLARAETAGIETGLFPADGYASREERDAALAGWLDERDVQLVVLAGFMELLGPALVQRFHGRIINVHPSLLPAFPGVHPIEEALAYGVRQIGVTVHFVDEGVDSGPIVLQEALELPYPREIGQIEELIHGIEHRLLPQAVRLIAAGSVRLDPDNPRVVLIEDDRGD
jgi:phosphoribosylglycinamide formyltransferase-1